jgi:hypothetical protein
MTHWIVRHRESGEEQRVQHDDGFPPYNAVDFEVAQLPREIGPDERWDWESAAIVIRFTPAEAAATMWELSKAHSEQIAAAGFPLPDIGTIQTDGESREAIRILVDEARDRIAAGDIDWLTAFINEENEPVPVTAQQILAIYAAVRAFFGACYAARQAMRGTIEAALAAGATAEQIFAIDITAGYPAQEP